MRQLIKARGNANTFVRESRELVDQLFHERVSSLLNIVPRRWIAGHVNGQRICPCPSHARTVPCVVRRSYLKDPQFWLA